LLKLDTSPFADSSNTTTEALTPQQIAVDLERRMCTFLKLLSTQVPCAIPAGIIFVPGPKLVRKGYGWAPTSWLTSKAVDSPDPLSIITQGTFLRKCGLEVQFPGYQLHGPVSYKNVGSSRDELRFSVDPSLLKWYRVESAAESQTNHFKLEYNNIAIIMARIPVISAKEIALLVTVIENQGTIWHIEVISRVWISHENDHQKLEEARNDILCKPSNKSNIVGTSFIGEDIPPNLHWCVHGPCMKPKEPMIKTLNKANTTNFEPAPKMLDHRARTFTTRNLNPLNWFGPKA